MDQCASEIVNILNKSNDNNEQYVKIFHISTNEHSTIGVEPTLKHTTQMIFDFLTYVYQRNILASLIKYILLKSFLDKLEKFPNNTKGIINMIYIRIKKIIFECILTAFNASNYDNYLLCNYLIIIQSKLSQKISIFKKGASISTIYMSIINNLHENSLNKKQPKDSKKTTQWPLYLHIKDIRNLVASNMSLDKLGQLFNLPVSKLCFPYDKVTSIKVLKQIDSLRPNDDTFWTDTLKHKQVSLEQRLEAQKLFTAMHFNSLYDYSIYYLKLDCILLNLVVKTLFRNYLLNNINIFVRKNFSQSSLSYEQFFIIDPSKQIAHNLAPKTIDNSFINYCIKKSVTGGLCTSFVHNTINNESVINEHLKFLNRPEINETVWPNFKNISDWQNSFNEKGSVISTYDIRSLYPSAALKKLPVGMPFIYSRLIASDFEMLRDKYFFTYNVQSFCNTVRENGDHHTDYFKLLNKPDYKCKTEFNVLEQYLKTLPTNIQILRFQSSFTALGQLYIENCPVDGFLSYKFHNKIYIKVIQYNSNIFHGHISSCIVQNTDTENEKQNNTISTKEKITHFFLRLAQYYSLTNVDFEYVEISDCNFTLHRFPYNKFPNKLQSFRPYYTYASFLSNIYNNQLNGLIVLKDLTIKANSQTPLFGFIIQKVEYNQTKLSPYTQNLIKQLSSGNRVVSLHKTKLYTVMSTEYFRWLHKTFGFENPPDIYHAILFQTDHYLKESIEQKLIQRKLLKDCIKFEKNVLIRQNMEIQSELIKLMLNSCYGFTLCNVMSEKFKTLKLIRHLPTSKTRRNSYKSCLLIHKNVYLVEMKKQTDQFHTTLLGHVGCSILFYSKIILLKRLYFLLKYLNPTKAQLLYMDTDSAHFLLKNKNLIENVDSNLQLSFSMLFNKHFESGTKVSGVWVHEGFYISGNYIGEKCYKLYSDTNNKNVVHMKGLNYYFQNQCIDNNIDISKYPCISYSTFFKSPDFLIYKVFMSKDIFSNYVPIKRYFVCSNGSLPLKM